MRICDGQDEILEYFKIDRDVNSVVIPATVTRIGKFAFQKSEGLQEVIFEGESLTTIGSCAFMECKNLKRIEFPGSLITIEQGAFRNCLSLESVTFRTGNQLINKLGVGAFDNTRIAPCKVQKLIDEENQRRQQNEAPVLRQDIFFPKQGCTKLANNTKVLRVAEGSSVPRIRDIAEIFGFDYQQVVHGFTTTDGIPHPTIPSTGIWWPKISSKPNNAGWLNVVSYDEDDNIVKIVERNVRNANVNYYNEYKIKRQIVMANIKGQRCDTGYCYRFIGVFKLNDQETQREHACVWDREATEWSL